ncbi:glutathione S-transferase family protein [Aureimonas leprariae]|uniref:Glutathione S-transferase family protein n=1 Tax=Plantimonas leprariae TaxID=2615207 RepID=A0A7V7PPA0_9HYPH|nr:glutathione S-transferase family protein [Aureimonas leprariae]KAB0679779.1 glutathione S-transferase family protein [Aureimonas leprariae]
MLTIYGRHDSGNCYKPRLLLALLGRPFRHVEVDSEAGESRTPEFLAKNPNGKVPLLELADGRCLAESNAMLVHLGEDSIYMPGDPFDRAKMFEWLFFEQYSHEPFIAVRRALTVYPGRASQATPERLEATLKGGEAALAIMDRQLKDTPFLAGDAASLADIALFAYTHVADEGGFELEKFPAVSNWLRRVTALPGFQPMSWLPRTP